MIADELIGALEELHVRLVYSHPCEHGAKEVFIPPREIKRYVEDPVLWLAAHYGVTRTQYLDWHESGYSLRCAGLTSRGKPCRNIVEGGSLVGIGRWLELQGEYCHVHAS